MKKGLNILFILMLIMQSMFSSVAFSNTVAAEGSKRDIDTNIFYTSEDGEEVDPDEYEGDISVQVDWSINNEEITAGDKADINLSIPEQILLEANQSGNLVFGESEVATYKVNVDGNVAVEFTEDVEEVEADVLKGTFSLNGEIEEDEIEEEVPEKEEDKFESDRVEADDETAEEEKEKEEKVDGEKKKSSIDESPEKEKKGDQKKSSKENKTSQANDEEKNGFNLKLGSVTDLDDTPYGDDNLLDPQDEFKLKLDWNLTDGHNYVAGDTETFELPKGIKITEEMTGELKDATGAVVANYTITPDKKVELTFTDFVETHSNVKGWLEIISMLDVENVEEEDGKVVIDPIGEEGEIRIPIVEGNKDKTIEKKGTPNKGYNADEINWEVTINKNKTSLKDARVTDLLPEGTEYKAGSLKVTKLKVDLNGNVLGDGEEVDVTGETVTDGTLNIPLGDIKDAYRIEYVTTVIDDEETSFKNNATLSDSELDNISANVTITINRGDPLKKGVVKDYDPKTGIIEWYLEFNYNQKDLNDVTLSDNWRPEGLIELVDDSVSFQEMTIDENGKATPNGDVIDVPDGGTLSKVDDGFEVSGITTDKAYRVVYKTKVMDRQLEGFQMSNLASFEGNKSETGYDIGDFVGVKSAGNIDYVNKTIEWTIKVNMDHRQMNDVIIKDTLGEGLTLIDDSIKMTIGGEPKTEFVLEDGNPFTLKNIGDTDEIIIVTYKTKFDADKVPNQKPTNKADISWVPENSSDRINKEVKAETELNEATKDNSWKKGSYNPEEKEITWKIIANYRNNSIDDLNITDAPEGNQKIVPESVKVHELIIDANGNHRPGDDVTDAVTVTYNDNNTISVGIGKTDKAYYIEYKTSLENLSDIQKEYVNKAEVLDGTDKLADLVAKVGIAKSDTYGEKSGYQEGKQVHWSVKVNLGQQKINNLKLEDIISDNQDYLVDTFKVYQATVDGKGNATKGEEVSADQYDLKHTPGEQNFTVEWKNEVDRAFIVEYSTLFFEKHNGEVTNTYNVTGDNIIEDGTTGGEGTVTITQLTSGGSSGEVGYLVIDKVGKKDGVEAPLAGAEFDLIDKDSGKVLKSGTTDADGHIDFGRLLFGTYELHERVVPDGYVTLEEHQTVEINKKYEQDDDKESFYYEVLNFEPIFAIELSKTDDEGNALADAEFTLFDSDDKKIATATTDENGKILFEDLDGAGTYYVQETKAPAGYVLDEKKHEVEIGEKEQEPVKVEAENKARGAVQLTKTDQDTGEALKGVKFALQKEDNSGNYKTIKTFTTDENGQIKTSNTLEAGNYQFVETKGLDGYRTNGDPVKFTVNINSTDTQKYTMENEQYKGAVKLIKQDAATDTELKGAEFKLVDAEGEVVKENLITNDQGEIVVEDLFLGEYQLIETKAPAGYELDKTPIDIEITEDNQVVEQTMTNNKITNISVEKKWNNDGGETKPVTIKLLPTDETVELNEENDWKATFENLDVYDESGETIDYQVEEHGVTGYNSEITGDASDGFIVTNIEATSVSGEKIWKDDNSHERPDQITVKLLADGEKVATEKVTAESDWEYEFTNLDKYDADGEEITYTIEEVEVSGYETTVDGFDITNVRVGTITVEGEKIWKDGDATDRPGEITVELSREVDGELDEDFSESATVRPDNKGKWTYAFTDLAEFNEEGVAYTYTVEEPNVPDEYKSEVNGYDITNTRTGETAVSGTKHWKDDQTDKRPETITVNLLQNNVVVDTKEVTAEDNWKYAFTDLDKYDDEGQLYDYSVKEQDVEGYASEVKGTDITNTRSGTKDIVVNKAWLDADSEERPSTIVVYLKQNGDNFDTVELKADNDWTYTFTDLEAFDENGKAYSYSIEEETVKGYETTVDGFDITNLRVGETEISGTKTWLDDDSEERPEEITVKLLANGEETDKTVTVDADSDWEYEFTKLDKYDDQGVEIKYSVDEEEVDGYEKSFDGHNITNLRVGKTEVTVEKEWEEADKRYRPDSITVQLFANGEEEAKYEISDETDWMHTFTGLDKYDNQGKEINYTIEEVNVPAGYKAEIDGYNITNTQKTTEVQGEKTWKEVDNEYRPDSITVNLLANDEKLDSVEVSQATDWAYEFTNLPKYDKKGEKINYTIEEVNVPAGYKAKIDGYNITNTQKTTEVQGEKTWKEVDNEYRPDSITVNLLANDEKLDSVEVSQATDWNYKFTNLPKYDKKGEEINYTIEEVTVPGYETKVDGFNITNTQVSTEVSGTKTWNEVDEQYRPDTIDVQLLANGEEERTIEVSAETDWKYEFTDLAKFDKLGEKIKYTVDEIDIPAGYESEVEAFNITNTQKVTGVSGTKRWLDNDSASRPSSIIVQLLGNNEELESIKVTSEDEWKYEFTNLPKYDKQGEEITYTVKEKAVPEGYEASVDDEYNITNLRVGTTEVSGTKTWLDDNSASRPKSITVNLLQNGEKIDSKNVTSKDDWKYEFTDLAAYDNKGVEYTYTVEEEAVKGYESKVDGYDITNTLINSPSEDGKESDKDSDLPGSFEQPKDKDNKGKGGLGGILPSTATNTFNMLLAGALLLVVGTGFVVFRRRKA